METETRAATYTHTHSRLTRIFGSYDERKCYFISLGRSAGLVCFVELASSTRDEFYLLSQMSTLAAMFFHASLRWQASYFCSFNGSHYQPTELDSYYQSCSYVRFCGEGERRRHAPFSICLCEDVCGSDLSYVKVNCMFCTPDSILLYPSFWRSGIYYYLFKRVSCLFVFALARSNGAGLRCMG
jgi:hypothetical protein